MPRLFSSFPFFIPPTSPLIFRHYIPASPTSLIPICFASIISKEPKPEPCNNIPLFSYLAHSLLKTAVGAGEIQHLPSYMWHFQQLQYLNGISILWNSLPRWSTNPVCVICKSHLPPERIKNKCLKKKSHCGQRISWHQAKDHKQRNARAFPTKHAGTQHVVSFPFPFALHPVQPSSVAPTSQPGAHTGMRQTQTQKHTGTKRKEAKHQEACTNQGQACKPL